jgi:hypothetical protein
MKDFVEEHGDPRNRRSVKSKLVFMHEEIIRIIGSASIVASRDVVFTQTNTMNTEIVQSSGF